jgi:hypothetical protein
VNARCSFCAGPDAGCTSQFPSTRQSNEIKLWSATA